MFRKEKNMDNFEKVEKLKEKANVTYEEAKRALENSDWDILEAMIYLEQNGKVHGPEHSSFSTQFEKKTVDMESEPEDKETFGDAIKRFCSWCICWINKGNNNSFCVEQDNHEIFRVPITLLVVMLFFAFWVVLPLMVVGLFFNMRYHFAGPDIVSVDINKAMDNVADAAESIKNEFNQTSNTEDR